MCNECVNNSYVLPGFVDTKSKLKSQPSTKNPHASTATPCILLISYIFLLVFFFYLIFVGKELVVAANTGDTVFLCDVTNNYWELRMVVRDFPLYDDTAHNSSIFVVPTSKVTTHSTQMTFKEDEVYFSNASRSAGHILFIYQVLSLEYEVTARSENTSTTTDGELIVFGTKSDYDTFNSGFDYVKKHALLVQNFSIGANNQSKSTAIRFTAEQSHQYYFVTCSTPGNVTFSYQATAIHTYYDYKDYNQERCSVKHTYIPNDTTCTIEAPVDDMITLFAYVNPNNNGSSSTHIRVDTYRLLPPPSVLVLIFVFVVLLPPSTMMYFQVC